MYEKLSDYIKGMTVSELADLIISAKDAKTTREFIDVDGLVGYIYEHSDPCDDVYIEDILNGVQDDQDGHDYDCSSNYMGV